MVAGVRLTRKSKSTNLLGDTLGDWAEYVDTWGDFFSLRLKLGVTCLSCFAQRKHVQMIVF